MALIIKNTISKGLISTKNLISQKGELALARALEATRSAIVPLTPVKTGRLKGSIGDNTKDGYLKVDKINRNLIVGVVGTNVPYARAVEFGTSRFKGRFYFTRGFESVKDKLNTIIKNTLKI